MTFSELLKIALEKTRKNKDGFYFQIRILEVEKAGKRKPAQMKLQIDDDLAQHIFDNLNTDVRFGICIPRKIWNEALDEYNKKIDEEKLKTGSENKIENRILL